MGGVWVGQPGLFDLDERYAALSKRGDPLEWLAAVVDFEMFRADLEAALDRSDRSRGGRPAMDAVMMFQVLVPCSPGLRRICVRPAIWPWAGR